MGDPEEFTLRILAILIAITFHEFAHARVALAFGDSTAESEGRVTLNPLAHLDPIGTIGFVVGGFGWGKPVPVNSSMLRHPRGDFFVSAAGPGSNFLIAIVAALVLRVVAPLPLFESGVVQQFLSILIHINLVLCFFNLLPIFPLDGSHMAGNLLPLDQAYEFKRFNETYGMQILFGLILMSAMTPFSPLSYLILPPIRLFYRIFL